MNTPLHIFKGNLEVRITPELGHAVVLLRELTTEKSNANFRVINLLPHKSCKRNRYSLTYANIMLLRFAIYLDTQNPVFLVLSTALTVTNLKSHFFQRRLNSLQFTCTLRSLIHSGLYGPMAVTYYCFEAIPSNGYKA